MRVGIYASNQRVKTNKLVKLGQEDAQEEPLPHMPSESDLTEFESAVENTRSHMLSLKFYNEDNKLKLQNILAQGEFGLRKRKFSQDLVSPNDSVKRSKQTVDVPEEGVTPSSWTAANDAQETIRVAHPPHHEFVAINHHVQPADPIRRYQHEFVAINNHPQLPQDPHTQQQAPEHDASDSDDGVSVLGRVPLTNYSSSDGDSPSLEKRQPPDTTAEGEGALDMHYTLPHETTSQQDGPEGTFGVQYTLPHQVTLQQKGPGTAELDHTLSTDMSRDDHLDSVERAASITDSASLSNSSSKPSKKKPFSRRAKKSGTSMRPMLETPDSMEQRRASQSNLQPSSALEAVTTELPAPHSHKRQSFPPGTPLPSGTPFPSGAQSNDGRTLVRRTHWSTPQDGSSPRFVSGPFAQNLEEPERSVLPKSLFFQPAYQSSMLSETDTTAGAEQQALTVRPIAGVQVPSPPAETYASEELITNYLSKIFVEFDLDIDGHTYFKMIKLMDCCDVYKMHATVSKSFKDCLDGKVPTDFTFALRKGTYFIEAHEAYQNLWDKTVQSMVDEASEGRKNFVARVRV